MDGKELFEHLRKVISSERFLTMQNVPGGIPCYICPIPPQQAFEYMSLIPLLIDNLGEQGVTILEINLYDLTLEILKEDGLLEQLLACEQEVDRDDLRDTFQGCLDIDDKIIPKINEKREASPHQVIFFTGVGELWPYLSIHSLLISLHSTLRDCPHIVFFPGSYIQDAHASQLNLLNRNLKDSYYRAFNILDEQV